MLGQVGWQTSPYTLYCSRFSPFCECIAILGQVEVVRRDVYAPLTELRVLKQEGEAVLLQGSRFAIESGDALARGGTPAPWPPDARRLWGRPMLASRAASLTPISSARRREVPVLVVGIFHGGYEWEQGLPWPGACPARRMSRAWKPL